MKFNEKKSKKETFIGALRVAVDEETENFLQAYAPTRMDIKEDGTVFVYYPDHIEPTNIFELCSKMSKEIMGRK